MELLNTWVLNIVITALVVCGVVSLLFGILATLIGTAGRRLFLLSVFAAFAFSLLGFVTGALLADSRESAVGAVLPAVLTLLGAISAYTMSSKGLRAQTAISMVMICFTLCLLIGSLFGIRLRVEYEFSLKDPSFTTRRDIALQKSELAVDIERLNAYATLVKLRDDLAKQEGVDLSRFESLFEKHVTEAPGTKADPKEKAEGAKTSK
jgi:hypothetical protein